MNLKSQVANGLKWQAINLLGKQFLSLFIFTTLARLLDPAAFGLVGLVSVYLVFVGMFVDQGIGSALVQRSELEHEHLDVAFWCNFGSAVLVCIATILLAGPVATVMGEPRLTPLLRWSSAVLVINALSTVQASLLTKSMDFRRVTIRALLGNAIGGVVGVLLAFAGYGVWALIGQQITGAIAGSIFLWSVSDYRPNFKFSFRHFRELFEVGSSVFASSFFWFFSSRLDQIIIGRYAGVPVLGLYVIGAKLPDLAKMVTQQPVMGVSLPAFSKLQQDHGKMRQAMYGAMELNALVSFAVFVGIATVASDFIPLLFGTKWAPAGALCALLSLYALVDALQVFFYPTLLASGGTGKFVFLNILHAIGVLLACIVGIQFGIIHLVQGLILNALILAVPAIFFLRNRIGLDPLRYCKPCLVPALASIFMAAMVYLVSVVFPSIEPSVPHVVCKVIVGAISYLGFIFLFNRNSLNHLFETAGLILRRSTQVATVQTITDFAADGFQPAPNEVQPRSSVVTKTVTQQNPRQERDSSDGLAVHPRLRTAFVPVWHLNPYHGELQRGLARGGVDVWSPNSLKDAFRKLSSGQESIDILHLHALPYFGLEPIALRRYVMFFFRLVRLLKRNTPIVWTIHEIDNHDSNHRETESRFMRYLSRKVDGIIVHGHEAKRLVSERFGITASRIHVIPHGHYIDSYEKGMPRDAARSSLGLESQNLVLLFFGHLRPYKGIPEMVEAFKKIDAPNARLVIAGLPITQAMEDEIARSVAGDSRIKFLPGRVHEDKVQVYMNACDLVVLPYRRILTSGAAILAMSFGKACIAPRAGCVTDMMDDAGTIFFDPLKEGDLDRALRDAIHAESKLNTMGAHNLNKARQWDWETIGRQTAAVYRQCISARKNQI
jgi:PST family polysaccharide transporter